MRHEHLNNMCAEAVNRRNGNKKKLIKKRSFPPRECSDKQSLTGEHDWPVRFEIASTHTSYWRGPRQRFADPTLVLRVALFASRKYPKSSNARNYLTFFCFAIVMIPFSAKPPAGQKLNFYGMDTEVGCKSAVGNSRKAFWSIPKKFLKNTQKQGAGIALPCYGHVQRLHRLRCNLVESLISSKKLAGTRQPFARSEGSNLSRKHRLVMSYGVAGTPLKKTSGLKVLK